MEWIEALTGAVAGSDTMTALAAEHEIGITQEVTDGPEGTVVYHLQTSTGGEGSVASASFGPGQAYPEDVRITEDWDTAVAVATGSLNAQEAFITGRIRMHGDQAKLIAAQPVFAELSRVFAEVGRRTEYR